MKLVETSIEGLLVIEPEIYHDDRGYFFESYNIEKFLKLGLDITFKQDNESRSVKGVLRGLHFQIPPYEQGKLVRVIQGAVLDVAVDLRKASPTFGKWNSIILSERNKRMYWIPAGFAHGFLTLEEDTIFFYKCTQVFNGAYERGIAWNDPQLDIHWGVSHPILSGKDQACPLFRDLQTPF